MKPNQYVHTPTDGRGNDRVVFLNGKKIERVIYADTKRGIVRVVGNPIKLCKHGKQVKAKTMRGAVEVLGQ